MPTALKHPFSHMMITSIIAGFVLSILAPFGTDSFSTLKRLIYWIGLCAAGGVGAGIYDTLHTKFFKSKSVWLRAFGQSVFAAGFVSIFVFMLFAPSTIGGWLLTLFYVWTVSMVISGIGALLRQNKQTRDAAKASTAPKRAALIERLPPHLRSADIHAIKSEDHYVRIYTSAGDTMVLMRLSDAIKEIEPLAGLSPHRSWWVAEGGVKDVKRQEGKTSIILKNDVAVPVSRTGAKYVREARWV